MSDDAAMDKAHDQAEAIQKRIDHLKLEIVATGHALAATGDDIHRQKLTRQRQDLELLTFAHEQRSSGAYLMMRHI